MQRSSPSRSVQPPFADPPPRRARQRVPAWRAGLAGLGLLVAAATPGTVGAATPPGAAATGAATAADWLAGQVGADGAVEGFGGSPDPGATMDVALSLAAVGAHEAEFDAVVGWLRTNVGDVIAPGGVDNPARLGALLLVLDAAGLEPTAFGGVDLPARLAATLGTHTAGLYGAADPTYDGVYRQSLAVLGLRAHDIEVPAAALDWLRAQQCDGATPTADGGWLAFRPDTSVPCPAPDAGTFSGPDTNQTAAAVQALVAAGLTPDRDPAGFFAAAQTPDGGFAYLAGGSADPNSTALVIQALVALGADPAAGPWSTVGEGPVGSLLAWQVTAGADAGAMASPFSAGAADLFATRQAVWGLLLRPFPLGPASFPTDASTTTAPPPASSTSTSTSVAPSTSTTRSSGVATTAATAVTTAARYTG